MGVVQREASRAAVLSYVGLILGYINKGFLFVIVLTADQLGLVNLIVAVATLFAQLTNLGVLNAIPRFYPFVKSEKRNNYGFFSFNFYVILIGSLILTGGVFLLDSLVVKAYGARSPLFVDYYYWIIPTGIGVLWYKFLDSYLRVLYKNSVSVIANDLVLRLVTLGVIGMKFMNWINFDQFLMLICLFQFIPMLIMSVYLFKIGVFQVSFGAIQIPRRLRKIIFSYSFYSYLNSLGAMAVVTIDAMMVASQINLMATGIYTTVVFITRALMIPYGSIARVSAPLVAEHWKSNDMVAMKKLYRQTSSVNLFIALILFLGVWANRDVLFSIFPEGFDAGIYVFLFLMIGRLMDVYLGLNGTILVTSKKYKFDMIFTGLLFVLVVVLNLWLIPIHGIYGAAISTAVAFWAYNIFRLVFVWTQFKLHPFVLSQLYVLLVFSGSLLGVEYLLPDLDNAWLSLFVNSLFVFVTFPLVVLVFKLEPESSGYFNKILRKLRK